mgnify:CR=1 FL=1
MHSADFKEHGRLESDKLLVSPEHADDCASKPEINLQ